MKDWAIRCNNQTDHERVVLILDALDIKVFINARKQGFQVENPYLFLDVDEVIRVCFATVSISGAEIIEVEDAYEYLLEWKENGAT